MLNKKLEIMTKKYYLLLSVLFAFLVVFNSCEKDKVDPINEAEVLATYLESAQSPIGKDFVNTDLPTVMGATELQTLNNAGQVYIIDIRAAADFAAGHIQNAKNVAIGDVFTHLAGVSNLSSYSKIAIVCYSGQSAGFLVSLLRLTGNNKVFSLKWGMSSWNSFFKSWTNNIGNSRAATFTATASEKAAKGDLPTISTGKTDPKEILDARVAAVLTEGFGAASISHTTLYSNLSNYYIINYWPLNIYTTPGHIPGAIQYTPKETIKLAADLKTLPTNKTIVVYCFTGQTSAYLVAYLRLLGYDAKSLLYGTNGMIYDLMVSNSVPNVFKASEVMEYSYVTGK
jgi:rhodanese-related sulfurtransferase